MDWAILTYSADSIHYIMLQEIFVQLTLDQGTVPDDIKSAIKWLQT